MKTCNADGCDRTDIHGHDMCSRHYQQWARQSRIGQQCAAVKCKCRNIKARGLCNTHYLRMVRRGTTDDRTLIGPDHPSWKGDNITYISAHARVRKARGRASNYQCVDCSEPAADWSYRHGSPREILAPRSGGYVMSYSPDPMDYEPRCKLCHRRYDTRAA